MLKKLDRLAGPIWTLVLFAAANAGSQTEKTTLAQWR